MQIPNYLLAPLNILLGKLKPTSYDDYELIKSKKQLLKTTFSVLLSIKDEAERDKMHKLDSELTQKEFAAFSLEKFKSMLDFNNFNDEADIEVLEFWSVIKE